MLVALIGALLPITTCVLVLLFLPSRYDNKRSRGSSVQILVLGDIGHSPRMQYHALSIAKHGGHVSLVGYTNSALHPDLVDNPGVSIVPLTPPPRILQTRNRYLFPVVAALKILHQTWCLWVALGYRSKPCKWMIVQVSLFQFVRCRYSSLSSRALRSEMTPSQIYFGPFICDLDTEMPPRYLLGSEPSFCPYACRGATHMCAPPHIPHH
ncbi:hypothetical protein FQN50_009352 [Emmonsiellopsis sp. PD_5]|nr:hypothetical protein FQN50_009352 [Emmonsiellopsis sp. PD_5]